MDIIVSMKSLNIRAWAKLNLTLDVIGKRPDGYHELSSVMQAITLYDDLTIEISNNPGITITTNVPSLPVDENNLIYKAAKLLTDEYGIKQGIAVNLKKYIPIAAGLAGGSSNCAATIKGINQLFGLKISETRLLEIARKLGADVHFCLMVESAGGTARAEGVGEKLTHLPAHPGVSIALARLPVDVSTKEIFSKYFGRTEGQTPAMIRALTTGNVKKIAENLANDLTPIATGMYPEILRLFAAFREQNALGVSMTGSGPTVFAYFPTEAEGIAAVKQISKQFPDCEMFCVKPKN